MQSRVCQYQKNEKYKNLLDLDFYLVRHQTDMIPKIRATSICLFFFSVKIHASFPEKSTKNVEKPTISQRLRGRKKMYPDQHQKFMGSILGWDASFIQVLRKSVLKFFCNPADKPTGKKNKKNNRHKHTVKMAPYNLYSRVQVTGSPEIPNWLETTSPPYVSSICFSSLGECCNAVPLWSSRNVFVDFTQLSASVRVSR